ncbi:MAG: aldehyde ferredoxin oxidoreductase family protein [Desulfobacterales bacterium]|jgi:aldehyde:ferredoxin oxidoreductase
MLKSYAGKIAWIDLSNNAIRIEALDEQVARKYLGGKGLGAYLLYKYLPAKTDPLDPKNLLIFVTGPLTGTLFPAVARSAVVTKSPLTGTFLDSYSGAYLGPHLKYAGYDAMVISGKADRPSYVWIDEDKITIKDAGDLWGLPCPRVEQLLKEELGKSISVAAIGPAGEKGVRFANIFSQSRAYGRGGSGAVMGSKNVKAVAVSGNIKLAIDDNVRFKTIVRSCRQKIAAHPLVGKKGSFPRVGTMHTVDLTQETGTLPSKNWQENTSTQSVFVGSEDFEKFIVRPRACFGCPIGCSRETRVEVDGDEVITEGPEYETIYAFGANCGIDDPQVIVAADQLCDEYGMDTISCGGVIGFAMECFEKGLLSETDTDGLSLQFGNKHALVEMIHRIGKREGIGRLLSEGVKRAATKIKGSELFAIHVKGLELPGYDPRGMKGQALTYTLSDRGGCHLRSNTLRTELMGLPVAIDRYSYENKAEMVRELQLRPVIFNSVVACFFSTFALTIEDYAEAISAATGWHLRPEELLLIAERIWNLTRLFNVREGFQKADDTLPERLFTHASSKGPSKGEVVDRASFEKMRETYYRIAGWDPQSGIPTEAKLRELDLDKKI